MENDIELQMNGFERVYDYSQYAHDNNINVIPEKDFKRLVSDTFKTITETLRATYGPYGSSWIITDQSETTTTKDGYHVFQSMGFNHTYKRMVYLAISKIIERVNRNVGDGTTSCILLAEKIFNNINNAVTSTNDQRLILDTLSDIENSLQDSRKIEDDIASNKILPLTVDALTNLINLAANYDNDLTNNILSALSPTIEPKTGKVTGVRTIVTAEEISLDAGSSVVYKIDYLPGDYRVRINMSIDDITEFGSPKDVRVVIYDHAFNQADWKNFIKNYNNEPTIILARSFTHGFMNQEWLDFRKEILAAKRFGQGDGVLRVYLAEVKGDFVQHEIQDLAAVIGTEARDLNALVVDHDDLPTCKVSVYHGNCLAFYDVKDNDVSDYINKLRLELENDDSHSYIKETELKDRIKALSMKYKDTVLTVKASSTLEATLIKDKIDDCVAIVNSALNSGIVPNLLIYAYHRLSDMAGESESDSLHKTVCVEMSEAITGLCADIWRSKYGDKIDADRIDHEINCIYLQDNTHGFESFNIIDEKLCDATDLPTSAQYDLEVVVAAISIVKYLLSGKGLIFDAHILPAVNDGGHYAQKY